MIRKSDLPATSAKQGKQVITQVRKAGPPEQRTSAGMTISCACGCGESLVADRSTQKFLPGHRFNTYTLHACPDCGVKHRVSKKGQQA